MQFTPTPEQVAVIDAVKSGGNVTVRAAAGAGKTFTLVLASEVLPGRGIFTAFNTKIVKDSARKFGPNVKAATLHSLAFGQMCTGQGRWRIERTKYPRLSGYNLAKTLGSNEPHFVKTDFVTTMLQPADLAFMALATVDRWCDSDQETMQWWHVPARPGMNDTATRKAIAERVLPLAAAAWADMTNPRGVLRRSHSHYLKEWALTVPQLGADYFMLDEAQDSNGVTMSILRAQRNTQVITVGDENQAIYGWRGAVDAMAEFDGTVCTLTQSFRFGQPVADWANLFLELNGSDMRVRGFDKINSVVGPIATPQAILTRTNAAAVTEVMQFQADGVPVALLGGGEDVAKMAEGAAKLMAGERTFHPDMSAFDTWSQFKDYTKQEAGADLKVFVQLVDDYGTDAIISAMRRLADARSAQVVVSTTHKCKGAEWGSVKIAADFREPKRDEDGGYEWSTDAGMLLYVGVTRAKTALDAESLSWAPKVLREVRGDRAGLLAGEGIVRQITVPAPAVEPEPEPTCGAPREDGRYPAQVCTLPAGHLDQGVEHAEDQYPGYSWVNPGDRVAVNA